MHNRKLSALLGLCATLLLSAGCASTSGHGRAAAAATQASNPQSARAAASIPAQRHSQAILWNKLGTLQRRAGQFSEARTSYEKALAANSAFADAELNLAILYDIYLQQPALAVPHYLRYQRLAAAPDQRVSLWIAELSRSSAQSGVQP